MPRRPDLSALGTLGTIRFEGVVFRIVREGMRERILSTEGNRSFPGRYHQRGETGVLYTSLTQRTALGEKHRQADPAYLTERLATGRIRVRLTQVIDLTRTAALDRLGLTVEDLTSDDCLPTQAVSLRARELGIQGLLVPSATGEGTNLVIFEDNFAEGCLIEVEEIGPTGRAAKDG